MAKKKKNKTSLFSCIPDDYQYNSSEDFQDYLDDQGGYSQAWEDSVSDENGEDITQEKSVKQDDPAKAQTQSQTESSRKLSPYEITKKLLENYCIRKIGGTFYVYDDPLFTPLPFEKIVEFIQNSLSESELVRLSMPDLKGAYEYLMTISGIQIKELPIRSGCVMFENGFFDIVRQKRLENSSDFFCLNRVQACYQIGEISPTPYFDNYLQTTSGGDPQIQHLLLTCIAYCLLPDQDAKCFFVWGTASNSGKSVLASFLQRLVGSDFVSNLSLNDLNDSFALSQLVGKTLNCSMDLDAGPLSSKAVSVIKMLTGSDTISINEKYKPRYSYRNLATCVFGTNSPVQLRKSNKAFWERVVIVPFLNSVQKNDQDKNLLDKLWSERDGIVSKAMLAGRELILNNYIFPECLESERMKTEWSKNNSHTILTFVEQCCDLVNPQARTFTRQLYSKYLEYCSENYVECETSNAFSRVLTQWLSLKRDRWMGEDQKVHRGFWGISLK